MAAPFWHDDLDRPYHNGWSAEPEPPRPSPPEWAMFWLAIATFLILLYLDA